MISIITDLMAKARDGKFEDEELQRAKGVILTTQLLDRQTNSERAAMAALDELYGLGYDFSDKLPEIMESVKMADVQAVGKKFLAQPVIAVVTPDPTSVQVPGYEPVIEAAQTQPAQSATGRARHGCQNAAMPFAAELPLPRALIPRLLTGPYS